MSAAGQSSQVDIVLQLQEIMNMGFEEKDAREALEHSNGNVVSAVNYLVNRPDDKDPDLAQASNPYIVKESLKIPSTSEIMFQQDIELNRAIENSIKEAGQDFISYEPLNPESSKRKAGTPVGLKNIGNTCYFNSLVQFYFMIPKLVQEILTYSCHPSHQVQPPPEDEAQKQQYLLKNASIALVENLQKLLSSMVYSTRKYIDPTKVLHALVDDFGNQILVGDQKDVGEFHMILVARIEEGLKTRFPLQEVGEVEEEQRKEPERESPIRRKESMNYTGHRLSEDGIISQLFYAKQIEHLRIPSGANQEFRNEVVFGQIILDVDEKDLYSAWDASYNCTIEDYSINEVATPVVQEIWPQKFPGVLLFQIQRVKYDRLTKNSIKINKPFQFPQEIYPDRFLLKNKQESTEIRHSMLELKKKARILERHIEYFTNYQESEIPLEKILENVSCFIDRQTKPQKIQEDGKITPDSHILDSDFFESTKLALENYKKQVADCVQSMQFQLDNIYAEISNLYLRPDLQKHKYKLHSLLIHDGYAGSGHYYAFVHDIESDKWRKYSDLLISDIKFEDVMRDAVGGNGLASAYCLFYVEETLLQKNSLQYWDFEMSSIQNTVYLNSIPDNIRKEIEEDNSKLEEEILAYQASSIFQSIQRLYENRLEEINKIFRENNNLKVETIRFALINFPFHLKVRTSETFKKFLLDMCVKEITGRELESYSVSDPLFAKLKLFYPTLVVMFKTEKELIQREINIFTLNYFDAEIGKVVAYYLVNDRFVEAFKVLVYHNEDHGVGVMEYQRFITDCAKALAFRLTSEAFRMIYEERFEEALMYCSVVGHIAVNIMESTDYCRRVMIKRIESVRDEINKSLRPGGSEWVPRFAEVIDTTNTGEIIAGVDFENMPEEVEFIRARKAAFEPSAWFLGVQNDDIACMFTQIKRNIEAASIIEWFKLSETISRTRSFAEKMFKDVEKKNGITPNRN